MTEPTKVCRCGDKCQCRADVPHGCPNARQCECRADAERREAAITRNLAMTYLRPRERSAIEQVIERDREVLAALAKL